MGSPSTLNIQLTFPSPSSLDVTRLSKRIYELQQLWPLLSIRIAKQRTTCPTMQYHYSPFPAEQILCRATYVANPDDLNAERDTVYDTALRMFQTKISFDSNPAWGVILFRASSNPDDHRLYLALVMDHILGDGRGAVKLAKALVAEDISQLPKEDIELYAKAGDGVGGDELPPYLFIASTIFRHLVVPRLPGFMQGWLGYVPAWPQKISQPTIDSPWKSSIVDVPAGLMQKLKEIGKGHGIATLNPTLHTAWVLAIWAVFVGEKNDLAIRDCSIKDLRDVSKGDPYCLAGRATVYLWSTGRLANTTRFWALAQAYAVVSTDEQAYTNGWNMMKMMNLIKDGPMKPEQSKYRAPDRERMPAGDKRAHKLHEEEALKKINSLEPYNGMSGIWSNLSYLELPDGATDMVFGVSGNDTGTAFNTCLLGHENGVRVQNAYSDGAAMNEEGVKKVQKVFLSILESIAAEDKDWDLGDLLKHT